MALVDWLQYTLVASKQTGQVLDGTCWCKNDDVVKYIMDSLMINGDLLKFETIKGINFYRYGLKFNNGVRAYFGSISNFSESAGINIVLTGKCLADLNLNIENWLQNIEEKFIYKISRLDIAIDCDINMQYFIDKYKEGLFVSKYRTTSIVEGRKNLLYNGCTIYFGSRGNNTFFRIYDKKFEQICKLKGAEKQKFIEEYKDKEWTRIEGVFKGEQAANALSILLLGNIGDVFLGHVRFVNKTHSRLKNCEVDNTYKNLIKANEAIVLSYKKQNNLNLDYIIKIVMPQIKAYESFDKDLYIKIYDEADISERTIKRLSVNELEVHKYKKSKNKQIAEVKENV